MNIQNISLIFALIGVIGSLTLAWFFVDARKKITTLLGGHGAPEDDMQKNIAGRLARLETRLDIFEPRLEILEKISKISVQKVGFLRFNPFQDTGGDNSFIAAFLDRENNGILLSSLYTREGVRLYAKHIQNGVSKHHLSEEEKKVLEETIHKMPNS
jgi:hypothetical protein